LCRTGRGDPVDRPAQSLAEVDGRLISEPLVRKGDVGLTHQHVSRSGIEVDAFEFAPHQLIQRGHEFSSVWEIPVATFIVSPAAFGASAAAMFASATFAT
jgi:hypothetical protein